MGHLPVNNRLKIISEIIQKREDLQEFLELQRKILQVQLEVDDQSNKGVKSDWNFQLSVPFLEQKSLEAKKPIIHFLNLEIFDEDLLISMFRKVVKILISTHPDREGLSKFLEYIEAGKICFMKLIEAALREDETLIISCAEKIGVEPSLLIFLINTPIQPFIEEISRRASPSFYNRWWRANCPICGRMPRVARIRSRKRYLMCDFCGAEYLSDYVLCVNCGNKDPYTLKYLKIEGKPEFQIDFCDKCKHYIKIIIEKKLGEPIPRCVEDMLTLDLDIEAKQAGLIRNG